PLGARGSRHSARIVNWDNGGGSAAVEWQVHVVLVAAAPDREERAARRAQLDDALPIVGDLGERGAAEPEEAIAALHPDARGRPAGAHAAHGEPFPILADFEPEEPPSEGVRLLAREGRRAQGDVLIVVLA